MGTLDQPDSGRNPIGKNQSLEQWYARKEEKRLGIASKGHGRSQGLRRTELNKVSKKQQKKNREYNKAKKEHYNKEENQCCHFCGRIDWLSVHHIAKRLEGNHDKKLLTACLMGDYLDQLYPELNHSHAGGCHNFVEANKSWAREQGYLV